MSRWPRSAWVAALMLAVLLLASALIPWLSPWSPWDGDYLHGQLSDGRPCMPGRMHLLGTDRLLRDVLVRLAIATRRSLGVTSLACALTACISMGLGCMAGYFQRGLVDRVVLALTELALGFPALLVLMTIGSVLRQVDAVTMAGLMALVSWPWMTTTLRARAAQVSELDYVHSARALGASHLHVLRRHILPNVAPIAVRLVALSVAPMILLEAALAYVGVGSPPPAPTLGRMLYEGQDAILGAPWLVLAPAGVLIWAGISCTFLANAWLEQDGTQ